MSGFRIFSPLRLRQQRLAKLLILAGFGTLCLAPMGSDAQTPPTQTMPKSGFELLDRVARHYQGLQGYQGLQSYQDHGTIERVDSLGNRQELEVETLLRHGDFELVLRIDEGKAWRRIWRRGDRIFEYESTLNQFRKVDSLAAAIAAGLGNDGYETLIVPLALAGSPEPFADVQAVSLEGRVPCAKNSKNNADGKADGKADGDAELCDRLLLSRDGGLLETELWIDPRLWIRRIEVSKAAPILSARKTPRYDLPDRRRSGRSTVTVVLDSIHTQPPSRPPSTSESAADLGQAPFQTVLAELPSDAQEVESWQQPESPTETQPGSELETFSDQITVRLVRFRVYAVDRAGSPLPDLGPDDFEATWGKKRPIPVVAVQWVDADAPEDLSPGDLSPLDRAELKALGVEPPTVGRRVVIFVQSAFESVRKSGHRRLLNRTDEILAALGSQDQVAVVSFDSHLKLWLDWSRNRDEIAEALRQTALGFGALPKLRHSDEPAALSTHWDFRQAKKAASPERALELTARAMAEVAGEKLMIYLGWGLGRFSREGVRMTSQYGPAVEALEAAHTSVFVLDVTDADYHSLEVGLQSVAAATGGAYYRTRHFAQQSVRRLASTLSGHYLVTLDGSALTAAQEELTGQSLDLRLMRPKSELLGPPLALE